VKLGIGSYTYTWSVGFSDQMPAEPLSALGLLAKARDLGVRVVQIGPNLPLDRLSAHELESLVTQARQWEITLEVGTTSLEPGHLRQYVSITRQVGATLLRTVPDVAGGNTPTLAQIADQLGSILPDLAASKVSLAIENYKVSVVDLSRLMEALHSPWVGICLDTVNSLAVPEGTEVVAKTLAPYTKCLHVKDFIIQRVWHMMGFTVEGRPAGKGQLNIPWLLELLRSARVSPNVILELWVPPQKTLPETVALEQDWAVESIKFLRRYISN
jgi:sugar phosphate isomerase/epimerase